MARMWVNEEINSLLEFAKLGLSNAEIAQRLNRTQESISWKLYKNMKIRKNDLRLPKFNKEDLYRLYHVDNLTLKAIAQKFNCSAHYVFVQMKKFNIPRRKIPGKKPLQISNINYQQLTPEKAYILGVLCGDGVLIKSKIKSRGYLQSQYLLRLNVTDKDFSNKFANAIKVVYGIEPSKFAIPAGNRKTPSGYSECKKQFVIYTSRKGIYTDLSRYGDFLSYRWRVPEEIKNDSGLIISNFLRGFYDSEGSIDINNKSVSATSVNRNGLENIKYILKKIGIFSSIRLDKRGLYKINFALPVYIKIFKERVGFSIERKMKKLISISQKKGYPYGSDDYWGVLRLRTNGYSSNKISKITGFPRSTVKSWFKRPSYVVEQELKEQ